MSDQPKLCIKCGTPIDGRPKFFELDGSSHYECWLKWAREDSNYQKELAEYKAKGEHVDYYMADPDDFPPTEAEYKKRSDELATAIRATKTAKWKRLV